MIQPITRTCIGGVIGDDRFCRESASDRCGLIIALTFALHFDTIPTTPQCTSPYPSVNPGDSERRLEGLFLVDTGAIDCMAPGKELRTIGIMPKGKRTYELADGSEIVLEIGVATVEFMGEVVGATIIFGEDDTEPILGVTALESVGIEVDPQNQRLKRLPAIRLKSLGSRNHEES